MTQTVTVPRSFVDDFQTWADAQLAGGDDARYWRTRITAEAAEIRNASALTMSSREIADLVESRHDKVKISIDRLADRGLISQPPLGDGGKSANGVVKKVYLVGKRDSYVVVARLSPESTMASALRWAGLLIPDSDALRSQPSFFALS